MLAKNILVGGVDLTDVVEVFYPALLAFLIQHLTSIIIPVCIPNGKKAKMMSYTQIVKFSIASMCLHISPYVPSFPPARENEGLIVCDSGT